MSHPLLSETVVIKTGPCKGLLGIVKDVGESFLRVELHSQSKVVNIPIEDVSVRSSTSSSSRFVPANFVVPSNECVDFQLQPALVVRWCPNPAHRWPDASLVVGIAYSHASRRHDTDASRQHAIE